MNEEQRRVFRWHRQQGWQELDVRDNWWIDSEWLGQLSLEDGRKVLLANNKTCCEVAYIPPR